MLYNCVNKDCYENPVLEMDYSDPDVIRVGEDYYLVSSSFTYLPGVPLLHSRDLIHWEQLSWCLPRLPFARYDLPAHGCGSWAPSIRYHEGRFYVFIPLPDEGIFVVTATDPRGPWSEPHCIRETVGWIDPCPFWDEDGNAYMAHAFANSRCGIKHRIDVCRMSPDASSLLDDGVQVYCNPQLHPTMEGPKMYKREGYYYIFVPAGGVATGWQTVLRSRSPLGPYEAKVVLHQGQSAVNGPHQGAWVTTPEGADWFFHFQDAGVHGRILHLQPMCWVDGWPVMGRDRDGDGIGEPVDSWPLPLPAALPQHPLQPDDGFEGPDLALCWQWQGNPRQEWYRVEKGLRLFMPPCARGESLLWYMPNVLTQIAPAKQYTLRTTLTLEDGEDGDEAGLTVMGHRYSALSLRRTGGEYRLVLTRGLVTERTAQGVAVEQVAAEQPFRGNTVSLELRFDPDGMVRYAWAVPGTTPTVIGPACPADKSTWSGARPGLFARNHLNRPTSGSAWFNSARFGI